MPLYEQIKEQKIIESGWKEGNSIPFTKNIFFITWQGISSQCYVYQQRKWRGEWMEEFLWKKKIKKYLKEGMNYHQQQK